MIPEAAVEAAARAVAYEDGADYDAMLAYDAKVPGHKDNGYLIAGRNILEAAAPHMLASVADEREGDLFRFTLAQREWLRGGAK